MVKKGDTVRADDPLITFEQGISSSEISDILDSFGDDLKSDVDELSAKHISAKHTGEIINVEIYYNADISEMTSSMQKIVKKYVKETGAKVKAINTALGDNKKDKKEYNSNVVDGKVTGNRIMGQEIDGIMIRFYIEYPVSAAVGDKINL